MMTVEAMQKLSADWPNCHRDAGEMSRLALGVQALSGIENLGVPYCMTVEAEAMGGRGKHGHHGIGTAHLSLPLEQAG